MTNETIAKQHTPGPWHVGMKPGPIIYGPKGEQVADLSACMVTDDETVGNGKLIARAPTLLAENESLRQQNAELVRALKKSVERIEQLCTTANNLSNMLKLGDKVRAEHFTDHARAILATVQS